MSKYTVFNFGLLHLEWSTALYVFAVFMIVMFGLNSLLFRPIIRSLRKREDFLSDLKKQKGSSEEEFNKLQNDIEEKLKETKQSISQQRKENREEIDKEVLVLITEAKIESSKILEKASKKIEEEMSLNTKKLGDLSESISSVILQKVL